MKNEKYCGDVLHQKTFVSDCIERKHIRNTGQLPMYLIQDHHEGIISREEALSHPARHSLTSALMGKEVPLVDLREECFPLFPGDRVLVASDGVGPYLDSLGPAGMRYLSMLSAEELVRSVLDGINRDGAPNQDNATLICAEIARA